MTWASGDALRRGGEQRAVRRVTDPRPVTIRRSAPGAPSASTISADFFRIASAETTPRVSSLRSVPAPRMRCAPCRRADRSRRYRRSTKVFFGRHSATSLLQLGLGVVGDSDRASRCLAKVSSRATAPAPAASAAISVDVAVRRAAHAPRSWRRSPFCRRRCGPTSSSAGRGVEIERLGAHPLVERRRQRQRHVGETAPSRPLPPAHARGLRAARCVCRRPAIRRGRSCARSSFRRRRRAAGAAGCRDSCVSKSATTASFGSASAAVSSSALGRVQRGAHHHAAVLGFLAARR